MLPESYTLIVPHQRASSGGVHVIEQFARHLARFAEVNLAVRRGATRPLEGVRVIEAPGLDPAELPDAEVLVGGLAQPDPERVLALPARKGQPLFLFQGYGEVGNPRVRAMLERRPRVLAVSGFLAEDARAHGCAVELARPGLDREVFRAGPPCERRGPLVAMLAHDVAVKATADGLEALARVRAALPEVQLRLFGAPAPPPGAAPGAALLGVLARAEVAALLREASVLLCPSIEEGLGLPGLEALACGAALASTDTKGGRDYALHERTALVTPAGRPDLLARSALALLEDRELRGRLAAAGQAHVLATYPPWPRAAELFAAAAARLLGAAQPGARRGVADATPVADSPADAISVDTDAAQGAVSPTSSRSASASRA